MKINVLTAKMRKALPLQYCGAVIVAAGNASRMGGIDKIMAPLGDDPVIVHTVRAFNQCDAIREIIVVTRQDLLEPIMDLCAGFEKVRGVVVGGTDRPQSVQAGINALSSKVRLVAVQDGARPLVSCEVIDRTVRAANTYGAAAPAIPVKDTIKVVTGGVVTATPDRKRLQAVQTPQVFDVDLLRAALKKARDTDTEITDDCSAVENLGMSVKIVPGDERNIKVTTPLDLQIARLLLEEMQ